MSWDDNLRISSYRQGPAADLVAEALAQRFHEAYERLAPDFGYETRAASRKPWSEVPQNNRRLMTAVCAEMLADFDPGEVAQHFTELADRLATAEQRLEAAEAVAQWTLDNFTNASVVPLLHAWDDLRQPALPTADDVKGIL